MLAGVARGLSSLASAGREGIALNRAARQFLVYGCGCPGRIVVGIRTRNAFPTLDTTNLPPEHVKTCAGSSSGVRVHSEMLTSWSAQGQEDFGSFWIITAELKPFRYAVPHSQFFLISHLIQSKGVTVSQRPSFGPPTALCN